MQISSKNLAPLLLHEQADEIDTIIDPTQLRHSQKPHSDEVAALGDRVQEMQEEIRHYKDQ